MCGALELRGIRHAGGTKCPRKPTPTHEWQSSHMEVCLDGHFSKLCAFFLGVLRIRALLSGVESIVGLQNFVNLHIYISDPCHLQDSRCLSLRWHPRTEAAWNGLLTASRQPSYIVRLMIEILRDLVYVYMYYATRIPMLLVHKVYTRSCRVSIVYSSSLGHNQYRQRKELGNSNPLHR